MDFGSPKKRVILCQSFNLSVSLEEKYKSSQINYGKIMHLLTRDDQTDGEDFVEEPDLGPGLEDPPGQPQLLEGEAGGQQEGGHEGPGEHVSGYWQGEGRNNIKYPILYLLSDYPFSIT